MRTDLYEDLKEREDSHFWHRAKRQLIVDLITHYHHKDKRSTKIVDIGFGSGRNIQAMQRFGMVWGIDASARAVAIARKRGLAHIRQCRAEKTSFQAHTFDLVTILDLLEHADDGRVLGEVHRILKKDGMVMVTVPAYAWLWSRWDEILGHKRRYSKKTLSAILTKQGFRILKISYCFSFLLIPAIAVRIVKSMLYNQGDYPSDFSLGRNTLHAIGGALSMWERSMMIQKNVSIPFGLSIVAVVAVASQESVLRS